MFRKKPLKRVLGLLLGLVALACLGGFLFPREILCLDSGPVQADAFVVLGGGGYERPLRAAELFRAHTGPAPVVIVSGQGDADTNRRLLLEHGIPEQCIRLEPRARSTCENAMLTLPLLKQAGATNVVVVTSWYHSRRALCTFEHFGARSGLRFYSRPAYFAFSRSEWPREGVVPFIRQEYLKIVGYLFLYGVVPLRS